MFKVEAKVGVPVVVVKESVAKDGRPELDKVTGCEAAFPTKAT
jgi:hypothetical protein